MIHKQEKIWPRAIMTTNLDQTIGSDEGSSGRLVSKSFSEEVMFVLGLFFFFFFLILECS